MNKFYVYVHYRESDGTPFYVGKGSGKRAYSSSRRNQFWKNTKEKHGIRVEIIFDNLTEEESFQCEIDTILEFKYFGYKLTNMTLGGEGVSGMIVSPETRSKISAAHKNRVFSEEHLRKISIANTGKRASDSTKEKQRQLKLGKYTGENNPFADLTVYSFIRVIDNFEFIGTRYSLCSEFNINKRAIQKLFYSTPRKTACGWKLKRINNDNEKDCKAQTN